MRKRRKEEWSEVCRTGVGMPSRQRKASCDYLRPSWYVNMKQSRWIKSVPRTRSMQAVGVTYSMERSVGTAKHTWGSTYHREKRREEYSARDWRYWVRVLKVEMGYGPRQHWCYDERNVYGDKSVRATEGWIDRVPAQVNWPTNLANFRPITLLNTDYKLMARIIA